jgi:hypothetical protein
MDELKNLKKYLYVLCEKIAGIKTINAGTFLKEYKLYFLLFVHRINKYKSSDTFQSLNLINRINERIKKNDGIDDVVNNIFFHIIGESASHQLRDLGYLNKEIYGNYDKTIETEITTIREKINNDNGLSTYFEYINTIIHNINPEYNTKPNIKYVNKYFNSSDDLGVKKLFIIYLINNTIYYYIILETFRSDCDKKIRFIFDNRYIKFSTVDMKSPLSKEHYLLLNGDIINLYKKEKNTHLFDLTNNIIAYEYHYLKGCIIKDKKTTAFASNSDDAFKKVKAQINVAEAKVEEAKAKVKEANVKVEDAKANTTMKIVEKNNLDNNLKTAYTELTKAELELNIAESDSLYRYNVIKVIYENAYKNYSESYNPTKPKQRDDNAVRRAVFEYNKVLFAYLSKYLELNFDNKIDSVQKDYSAKIETYLSIIKSYIDNCSKCDEKDFDIVDEIKSGVETILHNLTTGIKNVMNRQIETVFALSDKTMNHSMNGVIVLDKNIEDIYEEILYTSALKKGKGKGKEEKSGTDKIKSLEETYTVDNLTPIESLPLYQTMTSIIEVLKSKSPPYTNENILEIYKKLKEIVAKITTPTIDELKRCCLGDDFMKDFLGNNELGIPDIILRETNNEIIKLIDAYNRTNVIGKNSKIDVYYEKIDAYIKLIDSIKSIEVKAKQKRDELIEKQKKADKHTKKIKKEINEIREKINKDKSDRITELQRKKTKIEARIQFDKGNHKMLFDGITMEWLNANKKLLDNTDHYNKHVLHYNQRVFNDRMGKGLTSIKDDEYRIWGDNNEKILSDIAKELDTLNNSGFSKHIDDAIILAGEAVKLANRDYTYDQYKKSSSEEVSSNLQKAIYDANNAMMGVNANTIKKDDNNYHYDTLFDVYIDEYKKNNEEEDREKNVFEARSSVNTAIEVGKAIGVVQDKHEDEQRKREEDEKRKREAIEGVDVAIEVGKAIGVVQDKHEEEQRKREEDEKRKREAIEGVDVAINVGKAIRDAQNKHEEEQRKREEDNKRKREANDSVGVAIAVGDAIRDAQNKHEDEQRKREANDGVRVAIRVGDAIGDAQNKHEDEQRKNEAIEGVDVATRVGDAIRDAQNKHEEEERKREAIDGVRVATRVGDAIRDAQNKHEEEERKRETIEGVGVATRVGDAIRDAQNKHEEEERKRETIEGVGVATRVGDAIRDAHNKHEEEERKRETIEGVGVATRVGDAIRDAQNKHEEEERKRETIEGVGVATRVGDAIRDAQNKHEDEQRKSEAIDSVRVATRVGDAIRDAQDTQEADERKRETIDGVDVATRVGDAIRDAQDKHEEEEVEEVVEEDESESEDEKDEKDEEEGDDVPEPNVSDVQETHVIAREYKIDDEVLKGRYLATGLFKEAKDEDIRMAREYQMEQVRNRYNKKRGSINEMSAAIDEYNYPQTGGDGGDMIHTLNRFENDINNPIEAFEIKFEDRLVFIIATFFIRYVSMSIIQRGIDSNMVKTFYEGFIYYGVIYILLFWFIVLFINIDNNYTIDYIEINNLAIYIRSIFYYFYMGTNGISRLAIHTLLILVIIIIPILLNIKNGKARDTLNDDEEDKVKLLPLEERTKLSKALSLFTLFIWILTSIIASKF